ncbi:MAG: FecR domain-containing protein [Daejeonella sp.]
MLKEELKELLTRYRSGTATEQDKAFLESWYLKYQEDDAQDYPLSDRIEDANSIWSSLLADHKKPTRISLWRPFAAAAALVVAVSFGLYFYIGNSDNPAKEYVTQKVKPEIIPGGNNAMLTLADGRKISLTDAKNGELARQAGIIVTKTSDGQLVYTISNTEGTSQTIEYNTVETPNGGQYQLRLPDGSNVWLNAASSLKYPATFRSQGQRKVELQGEAYFEIARDRYKPFLVATSNQTVEVLGTHFNISSYSDEGHTKTTLLEGSVKVSTTKGQQIIEPGQQSILSGNFLEVKKADLEETMAWKNGYFRFNDEKIDDVLRKLSRWYGVEFQYEGKIPDDGFNGVISRSKNISQVLKMLEKTKAIQFKIEGRRITVMQ